MPIFAACSGDADDTTHPSAGGSTGKGGSGGAGGIGSGGGTGGAGGAATGGASNVGGASGSGGTATGGASNVGGTAGSSGSAGAGATGGEGGGAGAATGGAGGSGGGSGCPTGVGHPNEPSGYTPFLSSATDSIPSHPKVPINGWLGLWDGESVGNVSVQNGACAPSGSFWQVKYPATLTQGTAPCNVNGWDNSGYAKPGQKRELYVSEWIQLVPTTSTNGTGFEVHPAGVKLGFFAYAVPTSSAHNTGFVCTAQPGSVAILNEVNLRFCQQGPVSRVIPSSGSVTVGQWHQWEFQFVLNSAPDVADGILRWWLDGKQIVNVSNVVYMTAGNTNGFFDYVFNPTWGGNKPGTTKSRADFLLLDELYASGIAM